MNRAAVGLAIVLAFAPVLARAGEPSDLPREVDLEAGVPAPFQGTLANPASTKATLANALRLAKERDGAFAAERAAEERAAAAEARAGTPRWVLPLVAVLIAGAFVGGVVVGVKAAK